MRLFPLLLVLSLASPSLAQTAAPDAGKVAESLPVLDQAISYHSRRYADEKRQIYCGGSSSETIAYMGMAAAAKRDAVAISPDYCDALFMKGYALIDQGSVPDGIVLLEQALKMAPEHAHYLNELGYAYQQLKDWPKSLAAYQHARDAAGLAEKDQVIEERCRALRGMGFAYIERAEWDAAEQAFRDCLKIDPTNTKSQGELIYIRRNRDKPA